MDLMEMKSQTEIRLKALKSRFADVYEKRMINDRLFFQLPNGTLFSLGGLAYFGALVIEYADNYEEAKKNRLEDGDLFYLEKMDEETMFQSMLREIGQ